ncbi:hypothetical protein SAMN06265222_106260 [Neorhodopirellula lusitana]|uniref:Uncharacterized protein n=1 Tax=Neorhodopirellula lusitana TaxID=445327 RepID=A0ABY1Q4R9_9BACT|nr:hypothetical protein [Neorhodopirellula lusitana]SMP59672.1 hypothetical protein SAMN06265222_106260 [Neorhodopirellula lusitana]
MKPKTKLLTATIVGVGIVVIAALAWALSPIDYLASASQSRTFSIDCDYAKFRQIMVRKNATAAIVGQSGMTLLDEKIQDIDIDTSQDKRPLLNAIRGQSESSVVAIKEITVRLEDPALEADELVLRQQADIQPDGMNVVTESKFPAGNLKHYITTLDANPSDNGTEVSLTVALDVQVRLPGLFSGRADSEVNAAAGDAIDGQVAAIQKLIATHADKRLILPEFSSGD